MYVGIHCRVVLVDGDTAARVAVLAEDDTTVGILCIYLHPLPGCEVVTTGETPAGTNLQEVDEFSQFAVLEESLFADYPTGRQGGECSPIVLRGKLGRGIRTEQELKQVTVGVSVVQTSDV